MKEPGANFLLHSMTRTHRRTAIGENLETADETSCTSQLKPEDNFVEGQPPLAGSNLQL